MLCFRCRDGHPDRKPLRRGDERHSICLEQRQSACSVSGAAMDIQTVNRYDGAMRDIPCVWSRGSPHALFRCHDGHPDRKPLRRDDERNSICLEQRQSVCSVSGAVMDIQTVNRYDGAMRDIPCVWSRGSPHALFRCRDGHTDRKPLRRGDERTICLEQRQSACSVSGAAMDTQTVNRYDGAMRDIPCVWSRGSPCALFQVPRWTPRPFPFSATRRRSKVSALDRARLGASPTAVTPDHTFAIISRIRSVVIEKKWKGVTAGHESIGPN